MKCNRVFSILVLLTLLTTAAWGATEKEGKNVRKLGVFPDLASAKQKEADKSSASAKSSELPLSESPWAKWTFYSDDKAAQVTWIPNGGPDKKGCVHIISKKNKGWSFISPALPVEAGVKVLHSEAYASALKGTVNANISVRQEKRSFSGRSAGNLIAIETNDFVQIWATCSAEGGKTFQLSFSGREETDVCLAPVAVYAGEPFDKNDFGPIKGSAKKYLPEKLDRGLIALPVENGVYLSWRFMKEDPKDIAFNVYRKDGKSANFVKLNDQPITKTTDFLDKTASKNADCQWRVLAVKGDKPSGKPAYTSLDSVKIDEKGYPYISIKLQDDEIASRISLADLNGDGKLDYIIKKSPSIVDPYHQPGYWKPSKKTTVIEAYDHSGKFLWSHDFGWSLEQGIWYTPLLVYDLDGDGCAEVIAKTGKGDPRDKNGRVHTLEEYLTVFDGLSGKVLDEIAWLPRIGYTYNLGCRNFLDVAYLDGKTPFLIVQRGTYGMMRHAVYEFINKKLVQKRYWSNAFETERLTWGQGAHRLHAADIDGDGFEEVIIGSFAFDHDGSVLWSTGLGHPDHMFVGELNPKHDGMEIYYGIETRNDKNGMCMIHAKTGEFIWGHQEKTYHIHANGLCSDIDPRYPGYECFGGESKNDYKNDRYLRTADGEILAHGTTEKEVGVPGLGATSVWWDDQSDRVIMRGNTKNGIFMRLHFPKQEYLEKTGFMGTAILTGDFYGDWREEVVTTVPGEVRIYSTTIPAKDRHVSLLQDRNYRATTIENMSGYTSVPVPSYDLNKENKSK